MRSSFVCQIIPNPQVEGQPADKRLYEALERLWRREDRGGNVASFDLPEAIRRLHSDADPCPVEIHLWRDAYTVEQLQDLLRQAFTRGLAKDVKIDGLSIWA
jgi:hypothetical protein